MMTNEKEYRLKQKAEVEMMQAQCGAMGVSESKMAMPTIRERIHSQLERARIESRRCDALNELEYLLDKNPDVARILELMEQVR